MLRVYPCCLRALWLHRAAVPFVGASCCPAPLPPGFVFRGCRRPAARLPLFSLCLPVVSRRLAVCSPPSPRFVFLGCLRPAARCPVSSCCCLVFSRAFGLGTCSVGFLFPHSARGLSSLSALRAGAVPPPCPPPAVAPGGVRCPASCCVVPWLGVGCFVRRAVFCYAVLCCCAGALLCGVFFCCVVGFVVGHPPLALAAPFLLVSHGAPLRPAVLCGVWSCVVPSSVVVCSGVFFVAVWCRGCGLVLSLPSRFCTPAGLRRLVLPRPPPLWFVCRAFCLFVLPCCAG